MKNEIKVTLEEQHVRVDAPYHEDFADRARTRQGRSSKAVDGRFTYHFDPRDEQWVRAQCIEVYGTDDSSTADVLTIRADLEKLRASGKRQLWLAGRSVAQRWERDSPVKLGVGCVMRAGTFTGSGGSRKYPEIGACNGVVVEIQDVPRELALRTVEANDGAVTLVDDAVTLVDDAVTPVGDAVTPVDDAVTAVPAASPPNPLEGVSNEALLEEVRRRGLWPAAESAQGKGVVEKTSSRAPAKRKAVQKAKTKSAPATGASAKGKAAKAKAKAAPRKIKAPAKSKAAKAKSPPVKRASAKNKTAKSAPKKTAPRKTKAPAKTKGPKAKSAPARKKT